MYCIIKNVYIITDVCVLKQADSIISVKLQGYTFISVGSMILQHTGTFVQVCTMPDLLRLRSSWSPHVRTQILHYTVTRKQWWLSF
jgi:hypothetical protein